MLNFSTGITTRTTGGGYCYYYYVPPKVKVLTPSTPPRSGQQKSEILVGWRVYEAPSTQTTTTLDLNSILQGRYHTTSTDGEHDEKQQPLYERTMCLVLS